MRLLPARHLHVTCLGHNDRDYIDVRGLEELLEDQVCGGRGFGDGGVGGCEKVCVRMSMVVLMYSVPYYCLIVHANYLCTHTHTHTLSQVLCITLPPYPTISPKHSPKYSVSPSHTPTLSHPTPPTTDARIAVARCPPYCSTAGVDAMRAGQQPTVQGC